MRVGYIQVLPGVDRDTELRQLRDLGAETIFEDRKEVGTPAAFPELQKCLGALRPGDLLVIRYLVLMRLPWKELLELVRQLRDQKIGLQAVDGPREPATEDRSRHRLFATARHLWLMWMLKSLIDNLSTTWDARTVSGGNDLRREGASVRSPGIKQDFTRVSTGLATQYALKPETLSADERQAVEKWLESHPDAKEDVATIRKNKDYYSTTSSSFGD